MKLFDGSFAISHPRAAAIVLVGVAAVSLAIITLAGRFDSNILNLLPASSTAVRGLQVLNTDFAQTRELAFLLTWPAPPEDGAAVRDEFVRLLEGEPWVARVLGESPVGAGVRSLGAEAAAALMRNGSPEEFASRRSALAPGILRKRLDLLSSRAASGSPSALLQLQNDPLGMLLPVLGTIADRMDIAGSFDLESGTGDAFVVPVATTQADPSEEGCRVLMADVRGFLDRARSALGEPAPAIGVTGRAAYVEEVAASMRRDLALSSMVSGAVVLALFWIGFRSLVPLLGIAVILSVAALFTMAIGFLGFGSLNVVAISFCSILFGLGDDFCLLLCQRFFYARSQGYPRVGAARRATREAMPGIWWVAATTALGFLSLSLGGSAGFAQLGVLVALGILAGALAMPLLLFLFLHDRIPRTAASVGPLAPFVSLCARSPVPLRAGCLVLACAAILAILPWRPIRFDLSPASLEPRDAPASQVLQAMMQRFPAMFEPTMVLLPQPDADTLATLDAILASQLAEGTISRASSPSPLFLNPAQLAANRLTSRELEEARKELEDAADAGLSPDILRNTAQQLDALALPPEALGGWWMLLAPDSPWWFLVDRMFAPETGTAVAYLRLPATATDADRRRLAATIEAGIPGAMVTGWSQTLASLVPWAKGELAMFGGGVLLVILGVLAVVYREFNAWAWHVVALAGAAAGIAATLKLFNLPINLLNVLALPLILGVGVDYGIHILLAARESPDTLPGVLKAVILSALTTSAGFGALLLARNPALSGLGFLCAVGVLWCLASALLLLVPLAARRAVASRQSAPPGSLMPE
jgi:predicted exporter